MREEYRNDDGTGIRGHGGRIYARSKHGERATFVVDIQIVSDGQRARRGM